MRVWKTQTAPLRARWDRFAQQYPRWAAGISWTGRITKWVFQMVLAIFIFAYIGVFGRMPSSADLRDIETANASEIYTSDGVLIGKYYTENRTTIALDSISPYLVTALLAIEDKRFFEHSGIDLRSWLRVFKGLATNQQNMGGGSTLSQQLAKNLFPRRNYFIPGLSIFINKVRENIISIKLEGIYNKEELLTMYLNTVPFGGNRYGIQEAARYFYNKRPIQLEPDQAATLIGMLKATTALDPTRNPKNSQKRRNLVLSQMLMNKDFRFESEEMSTISRMINNGAITQEQYDALITKPVGAHPHEDVGSDDGMGTYFREYLRVRELPRILKDIVKENGNPYNIYTDGLKIYTSLDATLQENAEKAVYTHMSYLQNEFVKHWKGYTREQPWGDDKWIEEQVVRSERFSSLESQGFNRTEIDSAFCTPVPMKIFAWGKDKDVAPTEVDTVLTPLDSVRYYFTLLNCGFMAMDHKSGYVRAWVGGNDFRYFKYDHILSKRQVGSAFKPVVYTAALLDSVQPCDFYPNRHITIDDWTPQNSDGVYGGWFSVLGGLTYSTNVIAAQLIEKVGIQKTIDLARKMGITSQMPFEPGISLGSADVSLYEMMQVFGTIASRGVKPSPVAVLRIEDRNGQVIYDYEAQLDNEAERTVSQRVLDSLTASTMIRMMQSVIIYGTGNPLRSQFCPHGDFAGKTGTTQNHSDGWFLAFNPTLVTGAWVGGPSPAVRFRTMNLGSGSATALPVVGHFWYNSSLNSKSAELTKQRFASVAAVNARMGCPLKIPFPLDTLNLLLQDTLLKDSILRSGYKYLEEAAAIKFGYPMPVRDSVPMETPVPAPGGNEINQPAPRDGRRGNLQNSPEEM